MFIKARCTWCDWEGFAEVGHWSKGGLGIEDYECPRCGNPVKRPYRGSRDLTGESALLSERYYDEC